MSSLTKQRIEAIDQFRGFAIICMVLINYGMGIQTMPAWLEHAPDIGLTFPDLGGKAFVDILCRVYALVPTLAAVVKVGHYDQGLILCGSRKGN